MLGKIISKFVKKDQTDVSADGFQLYYQLFDRIAVDRALSEGEPGQTLDLIAVEIGVSAKTIRDTVSNALRIPLAEQVVLPSDDFLRSFNSAIDTFVSFAAIPQQTSGSWSYRLVVADPALVSVDAFRTQGVEVVLGDFTSITRVLNAWKERLTEPRTKIERYLGDIHSQGAKRIVIQGSDDESRYYFDNDSGRMGGRLSPIFLNNLRSCFANGGGEINLIKSDALSLRCVLSPSALTEGSMEIVIEEIRKVPEVLSNPPEVSTPKFSKDVLIVEDDLSFSQTLASIIESKGFSVCCVFSVEEFEQCIATSALKVRLVISDYRLGGRNGAEVMRVCGAMIDPIPVIFLTEDSDPKVEASMIQLGTQAFVRKSANPMILLAWILRLLEAPITDRSDEARTLQ